MKTTRHLLTTLCLAAIFFLPQAVFSQVNSNLQTPLSINADGSAADTTSMLQVQSTSKGMLTPRMTSAQRTAIASPANGLLVYDTVTKSFWYYDNDMWNEIPNTMAVPSENGDSAPGLPIVDGDPNGVLDTITLSQSGIIDTTVQIDVCVNITHGWVADLDISLIGPDGTTIDLSSDNGGGNNNYTNACFSTSATTSITAGNAPFTGSWIPEQPFSNFYTKPIAGPWVLKVVDDDSVPDNGTFDSWSIEITPRSPAASLLSDKDGDTRIQVEKTPDEDNIRFDVAGTEAFLINDDRNVFINNGKSLFVGGETSAGNDGLRMHYINDNSYIDHKGAGKLNFRADNGLGGSTRMVIDTLGNVGIGTADPLANLSITPFSNGAKITLYDEGSATNHHGFGVSAGQTNYHVPLAGNDHVFYAGGKNGNGTELMRIKGNGNVGIGINPTERLHVNGNIRVADDADIFGLDQVVGFNDLRFSGDATGGPDLSISAAGHVGIGGTSGNVLLDVNNVASNSGGFIMVLTDHTGSDKFQTTNNGVTWVIGDFNVTGTKNFILDHPLDPTNKNLVHNAVESPNHVTYYHGTVVLGADGTAKVQLPDYFEALNTDFHYQLTCVGGFAQVYVADEIADNQFSIAGGTPGLKVSWQVTATRNDPWVRDHPYEAEIEKKPEHKGKYIYPEGYGQPKEAGAFYRKD